MPANAHLSICEFVKINGFSYKKNLFLLTNNVGLLSVCVISEIFNCDNIIIFYLQKCKIIRKIYAKNSLEVKLLDQFIYKSYDQLSFKNAHCGFLTKKNELIVQIRYYHRVL